MAEPTYIVRISGSQAMKEYTNVLDYRTLDFKAGTYHKLTFAGNVVLYINDFGIRTVTVFPSGTKPYDIPSF
jgi:hypothetical protein